jgi:predicted Zn-dependent protease
MGLEKNLPEAVKSAMLWTQVKHRSEGKETEFFFHSVPVTQERIQRFERRLNKRKSFRPTEHPSSETSK